MTPPPVAGSRRRRLWELDSHAHCPVIGVCLPMAALRRLAGELLGGQAPASDHDMHCAVVAECRQRTGLAEGVQKELDRRFALPLQRASRLDTGEALAAWWPEAAEHELAGALWATLTHPCCTPALEHVVLGEVHMRRHQVGMATRVELSRFEALIDENAVLARQLAQAQQRCSRQADDHARRQQRLEATLLRLRAELITRDTALAALRDELQALQQARRMAPRAHERAELAERPRTEPAPTAVPPDATAPAQRADRAVLCVGGRSASVPVYRQVIEGTGVRFLHHDGGEQDKPAQLDATLAAADLVICQTGCVSHDAYWRVKDHCKRTGKRCLFVDNPSRVALERALQRALPAAAPVQALPDPG